GIPIRIRDLARVTVGAFPRRGVVTRDREPEAVEGIVLMRRGENPSVVLDALHAKIEQLNHGILPPGVRIDTFYDRARLVRRTLTTVTHNLVLGALLVVLVVGVFLMSLRARCIIIVAYVPTFSLQRVEGRIFAPMANTVCAALVAALAFSFTLVPLLGYLLLRRNAGGGEETPVERAALGAYRPALGWA